MRPLLPFDGLRATAPPPDGVTRALWIDADHITVIEPLGDDWSRLTIDGYSAYVARGKATAIAEWLEARG